MKNEIFVTSMYKILIYAVDIVLVLFSIFLTFMVRYDFNPPSFNYVAFSNIAPFIVLVYIVFMLIFGLGDILKQSVEEIFISVFLTVLSLMITTSFISFFARQFSYPRSVLLISSVIQFVFLAAWRVIAWKINRLKHGIKDSLVVGEEAAEYVTKKILMKQRNLYRIKYICTGNSDNLCKYLSSVDVVFICNDVDLKIKSSIVDSCLADRKSVYIIPDIYEISLLKSRLNRADDIPMLKVIKLGLTLEQRIIKRVLDIIISFVGLILVSPIMLIVAFLIKLSDSGNVFYKQERVTLNEKKFNVLKFRTMVMNAEKLTGPVFAGESDPRITKIGKFLRATRIDELPQLINVLEGSMSMVGPRPERPFFVEQFKNEIPDFKYRTLVKAGITGLAQVLGKYTTTPEDKVRYDILYIKNYSILMDIKLIFQTLKIVFIKESSEGIKDELSLTQIMDNYNLEITVDREENKC